MSKAEHPGRRTVFLDRDGTINVDKGFVCRVADWEWTAQAPEALRALQQAGFALAIVTNQSGIHFGHYTEDDVEAVHTYMRKELEKSGVRLEAVVYCRDKRGGPSDCPKPGVGMARIVEKIIGMIDYKKSWMIGDKLSDLGFGQNIGARTALIRSSFWTDKDLVGRQPDLIVESLAEAAERIVNYD